MSAPPSPFSHQRKSSFTARDFEPYFDREVEIRYTVQNIQQKVRGVLCRGNATDHVVLRRKQFWSSVLHPIPFSCVQGIAIADHAFYKW